MISGMKLGRIWGIPIEMHWSLFLVFGLLTWSLALGYFPEEYPTLSTPAHWLLAAVIGLLFLGSILFHELGHALVALRNQVPVHKITLFMFGDVAQLEQEVRTPRVEFRITIAGSLVNIGLAGLFGGLWLLDQSSSLLAPSLWMARFNLILAILNLIPGFPLDGGRILRAIIWWKTNNLYRATQITTFSGQLVAFGFFGIGIFIILRGNIFNGLWLILIGWFLQNAAAASYAQLHRQHLLRGITVALVMKRDFPKVPPLQPISQIVEVEVLGSGHCCFIVSSNGHSEGLLTLSDITDLPQRKWRYLTARQVMVPLKHLIKVEPDSELLSVLQMMDQANIAQVPVVKDNEVLGLLSREEVLRYLRVRPKIGI